MNQDRRPTPSAQGALRFPRFQDNSGQRAQGDNRFERNRDDGFQNRPRWGDQEMHRQVDTIPVQSKVPTPDLEQLNKPGQFVTESKVLFLKTASFVGGSPENLLEGFKDAYKSLTVKDLYVTARDGKNLVVALPLDLYEAVLKNDFTGFKKNAEGELVVRFLPKQAMKKLRG